MLTAQRAKNPNIDAYCTQITDQCVGITPDFLVLLLESRFLLLSFQTQKQGADLHEMESNLINLGLQAGIESRINPNENVRNTMKE